MKSEEIAAIDLDKFGKQIAGTYIPDAVVQCAYTQLHILKEIAYQLAVMNEQNNKEKRLYPSC